MSVLSNGVPSEKLLRISGVSEQTAIPKSTIWAWVKEGRFPQPLKLSPRITVWKESDIQEFIKSAGGAS